MKLVPIAAAPVLAALSWVAPAGAAPADFPDVSAYPAVDPAPYYVQGSHPSLSGWTFRTPGGLRCQDNLIAEIGVFCTGAGDDGAYRSAAVSLTRAGTVTQVDDGAPDGAYPLLPTGSRIATTNGVACAVLTDDTLACLAVKPDSWTDTPDPPDRHYGEHGFVIGPSRARVF
jgi:hypothetical protein